MKYYVKRYTYMYGWFYILGDDEWEWIKEISKISKYISAIDRHFSTVVTYTPYCWVNEWTEWCRTARQIINTHGVVYTPGWLPLHSVFLSNNLAKYYICKIKNEYYKLKCVCVLRTHEKYYCLGITVSDNEKNFMN